MLTTARGVLRECERTLSALEAALQGEPSVPAAQTLRGLQVAEELRDALLVRSEVVDGQALTRAREAALSLFEAERVQPEVGPLTRAARRGWQVQEELAGDDPQLRELRMRLQELVERLRARWYSPRGEAACVWAALAEAAEPDVGLWEVVAKALRASTPELSDLLGRLGRSFELELLLEESWPTLTGTVLLSEALQPALPAGGPQTPRQVSPRAQTRARQREIEARFEEVGEVVEAGLPRLLAPHASPYQRELLTGLLAPLLAQLVSSRMGEAYAEAVRAKRLDELEVVVGGQARPLRGMLEHDGAVVGFSAARLREGVVVEAVHQRAPRIWAELLQRRLVHAQLVGGPIAAQVSVTPTPGDLSSEEAELVVSLWRESESSAPVSQILAAARDCLR